MLYSRSLLVIHFKYSSVYMSIPNYLTISSPHHPPSHLFTRTFSGSLPRVYCMFTSHQPKQHLSFGHLFRLLSFYFPHQQMSPFENDSQLFQVEAFVSVPCSRELSPQSPHAEILFVTCNSATTTSKLP